jgi:hypothetical protein
LEGDDEGEGGDAEGADDGSSYDHLDNSTLDSAETHDDDYDDDDDDLPLPMHYGSGQHDNDGLWNVKPIEPGVPVQMLPDYADGHAVGASTGGSEGKSFPPLLGASATIRNFTLDLSAASLVPAAPDAPSNAGGEENSNALTRIDLAAVMRRAAKQVMPKNMPNVKVRPLEMGSGSHALVTPRVGAPLRRSGGGAGGGGAKKPVVVKRTALGALSDGDGTSREGNAAASADGGENGGGSGAAGDGGNSSTNNTTDNDSDDSSGDTAKQGADAAAAAAKARLEEQAKIAAENMTPPQMLDVHLGKTLIECDIAVDLSFVPPENESKGAPQKGGPTATLANVIDSTVAEQDALTATKEKEAAEKTVVAAAAAAAAAASAAGVNADESATNADGSVVSGSASTASAAAADADPDVTADGTAVPTEGSTPATTEQNGTEDGKDDVAVETSSQTDLPSKPLPSSQASLVSADGTAVSSSSSSSTLLSAPFVPQEEEEDKPPSKLELRAMELEEIAAELLAAQEVATASAAADTAEDIAAMMQEDGEPGQPLQLLDARFYAVSVDLLLAMRRFPSHEEVGVCVCVCWRECVRVFGY